MSAAAAIARSRPRAAGPSENALVSAFRISGRARDGAEIADLTPYEALIEPFLDALGWAGEPRHIVEALPHFDPVATLAGFRAVLHRLGYRTAVSTERLAETPAARFPLLIVEAGRPAIALERTPEGLVRVLGSDGRIDERRPPAARIEMCRAFDPEIEEEMDRIGAGGAGWFWTALRRLSGPIRAAALLTLLANGVALATPLFSMAIYNNVVRAGLYETLAAVAALALAAIALEDWLRRRRGAVIALIGARLNAAIQQEAFGRILTLPTQMTASASVAMQTARLKQFESVLNVFTGNLAAALFDIPFTILFLIVIALIGGPLIWAPIVLALVFCVYSIVLLPTGKRLAAESARMRLASQELVRQTVRGADGLRGLGAEEDWMRRLRPALITAAKAKSRARGFDLVVQGAAQLTTALAGAIVLVAGAAMVMQETLTVGALIAVMMLVWRALAPIQTAFLSLNQIVSTRETLRQIDQLMKMPPERDPRRAPTIYRRFEGKLRVQNLAFAFPGASEPALRDVGLAVEPDRMLGLVGKSGAGKTTLLKLLLKLYRPNAGKITLDGLNFAQLDPGEVRAAFAYAPETVELFFGTLAQNLRLAHRTAADAELEAMLLDLGVPLGGAALPEGLATRLTAERRARLTDADARLIGLARALVRPSPVLLIDDPMNGLDAAGAARVREAIARRREGRSVIVVTNDAETLQGCDAVCVLGAGRVLAEGAPAEVLPKIAPLLNGARGGQA